MCFEVIEVEYTLGRRKRLIIDVKFRVCSVEKGKSTVNGFGFVHF